MATIIFSNGQTVEFNGNPTPQDVEEVALSLGIEQKSSPATAPMLNQRESQWNEALGAAKNLAIGGAKGLGSTVLGIAELGTKTLGRLVGADVAGYSEFARQQRETTLKPQGTAQKIGFGAEQIGEFFVPGGAVTKAGKAIGAAKTISRLGKIGGVVARVAPQVAADIGVAAAQTGGEADVAGTTGLVSAAVPAVGKVLGGAAKLVGRGVGELAGKTTGAGYGAIKQAFRDSSPEFVKALRGDVEATTANILTQSRDALHSIADTMRTEYRSSLAKLKTVTKEADITDIRNKIPELLEGYGVKIKKGGAIDFSRSSIADKAEQRRLKELLDGFNEWGTRKGDLTPAGLDILKKRLDDFYSPSSQVRAFVTSLRNSVKKKIESVVPEYEKMTKNYAETIGTIKEIEKGLSLKDGASSDTAIRKLTSVLRQNNEFRQALVQRLEQETGKNITGQIAGTALSPLAPRGIAGALVGGVAAIPLLTFKTLVGLPLASPRLVGELARVLGIAVRGVSPLGQLSGRATVGGVTQAIKKKE